MKHPRLSARDIALVALMAALIEVCKLALAAVPNVELTSFLLILFTICFGRLTVFVVPVFILIEGLIYGFGLWWVMYLYAWPLLCLAAAFLQRAGMKSAAGYAVLSGAFGLLFGLLCSLPYAAIGAAGGGLLYGLRYAFAWWIAGIPFDLVHGASNFIIMLVLYRPMTRLAANIRQISAVPGREEV